MFNCFWLVCTLYGSTRFVFVYWPWFRFLYVLGGYKPRISRTSCIAVHSVIGVSLSLELGSGTVCRPLCAQPTCPLNGSNGHWRRFYLFETAARLWLFCLRRAGYKFSDIHTYIPTFPCQLLSTSTVYIHPLKPAAHRPPQFRHKIPAKAAACTFSSRYWHLNKRNKKKNEIILSAFSKPRQNRAASLRSFCYRFNLLTSF